MHEAIPLLPQYAFLAWCSFKEKKKKELMDNFVVKLIA
jgi:hypothetical protein